MNDIYEIFFLDRVEYKLIAKVLADFLDFFPNEIGTSIEYYNLFDTDNELKIGMNIYYYTMGYRTFARIEHMRFQITDLQLIRLVHEFAVKLRTNVTTGDLTDDNGLTYMTINPNGSYCKAYDSENLDKKNKIYYDFTSYTEEMNISEYLSILENK